MSSDTLVAPDAREIHFSLSAIFLPALLLRLYLLFFGIDTDHFTDCEPTPHKLHQAWQVLRFYLTLGKAPLPRWFSHNPLWGPIYLLVFAFMAIAALSGVLLLQEVPFLLNVSNQDLHSLSHSVISLFALLHLPAVFSHDLSNKNADISGMVNGYRIFFVEKTTHPQPQKVSLDDLLKTRRSVDD